MIKVDSIKIMDSFSLDYVLINFTIEDTTEDVNGYSFNIYRSNDEEDGYELISTDVIDFSFIDYNVNLYNNAIKFYYKVEVVNRLTGEKLMSEIRSEYKGRQRDNTAQAIIENYNIYLNNVLGVDDVYLLKKKRFGTYCSCYDDIRGRSNNSKCHLCYSTKYAGGYFAPKVMKVSVVNSPGKAETFDITETSEQTAPIQMWTANYPLIQIGDVIVDSNNDRYVVAGWQPTYKNYMLIRQTIDLQKLPKSDVTYLIPVKL
jgi:hypothetical protein